MPSPSDEPLRKVTLNLFRSDIEYLERHYGHGWTEQVRTAVRKHVQKLKAPYGGEPYDGK